MKAIVAVDKNWAIGANGGLLVHLPGDLKYFKDKTMEKVVVMGRSTFESLPGSKPLPGRINIVLSSNPDFHADCLVCRSLEDLFEVLKDYDNDDIYIIGGEKVYHLMLPYCDTAYVTKIMAEYPADKYFDNLDKTDSWEQIYSGETQNENGIVYTFTEYKNKQVNNI